ncbi:MAG: hypothetical protein WDM81_19735 [Rhizomicrobium sp.]
MAASGTTGDYANASRGARPLVIAYFALFAVLILFGIAVVLFGNPRAGDPVVRVRLPQTPARAAAGLAHPAAPAPARPTPPARPPSRPPSFPPPSRSRSMPAAPSSPIRR